ncbi:MAG: PQQ-dependent sugar dehydrogenase [Chitinophaga sp.]
MKLVNLILAGALLFPAAGRLHAQQAKLQLVTDRVQSPVCMATPADGSHRLFIVQKEGRVWVVQNGKLQDEPFIDVSADMVKVNPAYDERGLLGMAFHPDFKTNGKFYLYFSAPVANARRGLNHKSVVAEYRVNKPSDNTAGTSTKKVVRQGALRRSKRQSFHGPRRRPSRNMGLRPAQSLAHFLRQGQRPPVCRRCGTE